MSEALQGDFDFWWQAPGEWVEPPNERKGGLSGVRFVSPDPGGPAYYVKIQHGHLFRSLRYPLGRPTTVREWQGLRRCQALGVNAPQPVFFKARKSGQGWQAVMVTEALLCYQSLQAMLAADDHSPEQRSAIFTALAENLVRLHRSGYKHGHLYPKEVLVRLEDDKRASTALVDLEKCQRRPSGHLAAMRDLTRLFGDARSMGMHDDECHLMMDIYRDSGITLDRARLMLPRVR
ncbi:lipopolysaccharide kinase InaA family protein [Kushneria indalinina]|uniref:Lipopolysaccharide kinase (Kdo/WaaP) family protein n=1 Tax=Kushneria indalinina DSM 14324 TaxID=1122140 RepID=A0A3D9DZ42_9GAMM|nr:lipopolysaccharide kinase InaA family protein [Kushneria indalinina]REC96038.1 lipopolysaccharide kinase (Kdo/WaaP) family protein [Kushneria indalinina DSM 14324]